MGRFERGEDARRALIGEFGGAPRALRLVALELFIARLMLEFERDATLKGGMANHLRLEGARMTEDIDLNVFGVEDDEVLLRRLKVAGTIDLGDFAYFEVERDLKHPTIDAEEAAYGGRRFCVKGRLGNKNLPDFGLDIAFAEEMILEAEIISERHVFEVLGLAQRPIRIYPLETQIAEKFYIYSRPRVGKQNSRTKDLPDLALLAGCRELEASVLREVMRAKFAMRVASVRRTQPDFEFELPAAVPALPQGRRGEVWRQSYAGIVEDQPELEWTTLEACHAAVCAFLDPVLGGVVGVWRPAQWRWDSSVEDDEEGQV